MPSPELAVQWQQAVLWPVLGPDKHGQPTVGSPQQVQVRWNSNRTEMVGPDGTTLSLDASVIATFRIGIESRMWLGLLANVPGGGDFNAVAEELMVVKAQNTVPDIKNRFRYYGAGLMRWKNVNS